MYASAFNILTQLVYSACSCTMATLTLGDRFWRLRPASTEIVFGSKESLKHFALQIIISHYSVYFRDCSFVRENVRINYCS